ncbi:MAG TPA: cytochrome c [Rhodothermales bacterium]|nr:cytochrome c [Rhodothermales bacterium]
MNHWASAPLLAGLLLIGTARCGGEDATPQTPEARFAQLGERVYGSYCITCHQPGGQGLPGTFPPLRQTTWVEGDKGRLIRLTLNGMKGPLTVHGATYEGIMPMHGFLSDDQIAAVLTYVRSNFGNDADAITPEEVAAVRRANEREEPWTEAALLEQTGIPGEE